MIKAVTEKELAECVNVIRESFLTVAEEFGFTPQNAPRFTAFAISEERLAWQMNDQNRPMFAWHEQGKIIGYYSLELKDHGQCELNNLSVLKQYRHQGIGKALLDHAFKTAGDYGCTKMQIGIVEENSVLKHWYETLGFHHIGTRKFDFFPFTCGYMEKEL